MPGGGVLTYPHGRVGVIASVDSLIPSEACETMSSLHSPAIVHLSWRYEDERALYGMTHTPIHCW